jgi:hypothetical protein
VSTRRKGRRAASHKFTFWSCNHADGERPRAIELQQHSSAADGEAIEYSNGVFTVPDHPIIPFIEGDGTGRDIWKASVRVFDAAVEKAYGGKRSVKWYEVLAGEKAFRRPRAGCRTIR